MTPREIPSISWMLRSVYGASLSNTASLLGPRPHWRGRLFDLRRPAWALAVLGGRCCCRFRSSCRGRRCDLLGLALGLPTQTGAQCLHQVDHLRTARCLDLLIRDDVLPGNLLVDC